MRLLIIELWGIGDLTMTTPFIQAASALGRVSLLAKPYARPLLSGTFPHLDFIEFDAPWTAFRDKYKLWRWDWSRFASVVSHLRRQKFDLAISARGDVRDNFLMTLAGIKTRVGLVPTHLPALLTHKARRSKEPQHRTEDWADLWHLIFPDSPPLGLPQLACPEDHALPPAAREFFIRDSSPILAVHVGARIPVRRWPVEYFRPLLRKLKSETGCRILLIADTDGYGSQIANEGDLFLQNLDLVELQAVLGRCAALLCNDSGPSHIADALGIPVCAIFGPTHPIQFRPYRPTNLVVERDICPFRPCFDYCRFQEPYCLTKLTPEMVGDEIVAFLSRHLAAELSGRSKHTPQSQSPLPTSPAQ